MFRECSKVHEPIPPCISKFWNQWWEFLEGQVTPFVCSLFKVKVHRFMLLWDVSDGSLPWIGSDPPVSPLRVPLRIYPSLIVPFLTDLPLISLTTRPSYFMTLTISYSPRWSPTDHVPVSVLLLDRSVHVRHLYSVTTT